MSTPDDIIGWDLDADGIVVLTIDEPGQSDNTVNALFRASFHDTIIRLRAESDDITGVVITSTKDTFITESAPQELVDADDDAASTITASTNLFAADLRALETLGKPVVAALTGTATGSGFGVALAAHHRIALDSTKSRFGLPEVTWGMLPGAGGVVRTIRLLGVTAGLKDVLLAGTRFGVAQALALGLLDEVVATPEDLESAAKAWIVSHPASVQSWDAPGYEMPGGTPSSPRLAQQLAVLPAQLRRQTKGALMPAPHHILAAAVEGAAVDTDAALRIENRYLNDLLADQTTQNMAQSFWGDLRSIQAGGSRPPGHPETPIRRLAVIGAGLMGAGIALVSARNGIDVVLKDVSLEAARKGKEHVRVVLDAAVAKGAVATTKRDDVLNRISPTDTYADLADCDLVVEAVFENMALKHEVFTQIDAVVDKRTLLASNTSTLPITELARGVERQGDFIGLHFFSPVDKMPLLEIIRGNHTSDATLARALDYATQIGKTPIVVNDSHGFFTSRVFGVFIKEALAMLGEGIAPASIEQATTQAGYPVGALQLADELNMELMLKIRDEERSAAGEAFAAHPGEQVFETMVSLGRPGRLAGAGFFDYDATGKRTGLWPGLPDHFGVSADPATVDLGTLQERLMFIEALESARCVDEGVLITAADGNIGSLLGIGFPARTGGVLRFVDNYRGPTGDGILGFVRRADDLADQFGDRFRPTDQMRQQAEGLEGM